MKEGNTDSMQEYPSKISSTNFNDHLTVRQIGHTTGHMMQEPRSIIGTELAFSVQARIQRQPNSRRNICGSHGGTIIFHRQTRSLTHEFS